MVAINLRHPAHKALDVNILGWPGLLIPWDSLETDVIGVKSRH